MNLPPQIPDHRLTQPADMLSRPLKNFLWGALAGFTITATLLLPRWHPHLTNEDLRSLIDQRNQLAAALDKQNASLGDCIKQLEESGGSTILYEAEPASPPQAALQIIGQLAGAPAPPAAAGEPLPRWVIPARVQPILLGPSRGEVYYHVPAGKAVADRVGPFTPATPPATPVGSRGEIGGRP